MKTTSNPRGRPASHFQRLNPGNISAPMSRSSNISAGLLAFRRGSGLEVLLAHPGGPFWSKKDNGAWTIPKGLAMPGEDLLAAAQREFTEETNFSASGSFFALTPAKQKGGKLVHAWAVRGRLRSCALYQQHIRHRVAAEIRTPAELSGDRPRRLFHAADRRNQDSVLSAAAVARAGAALELSAPIRAARPANPLRRAPAPTIRAGPPRAIRRTPAAR